MSLEIKNLTKRFGKQVAVNGISFQAAKGDVLGFLGPNGAGKSTTMKMGTCFLPPTEGTAVVNGHDILEDSLAVKRSIGYLPEHNPLYLDMYVREFLTFSGRTYGLSGSVLEKRVGEIADMTGLIPEIGKKIGALSKGYRQRVGLAQALVHNPPVLIMDEPTTGLDPNQIQEIRTLIKNIGKEKTVILSTHIMQEVQAICNRYIIIHKGSLVAEGSLEKGGKSLRFQLELDRDIAVKELESMPDIVSVQKKGPALYEVEVAREREGRGSILTYCQKNDLDLKRLVSVSGDLESLFRQVTQGENKG